MAAQTLLILPALDDEEAILATPSGDGYVTRRVPITQISSLDVSEPVLILPGQLVRIFETELPKAGYKQQLKMARFAREDDIAVSADLLHFALSSDQPPHLAIIDISVMDDMIETLGALKPKAAYANYDLLRGEQAIRVIDHAVEPGIAALDLDWTQETLVILSDDELAQKFSDGLTDRGGLNLMQGAYRPQSKIDLPRIPSIRFAAIAASALVAFFIWGGVKNRAASAQAKEMRAETAVQYQALTGQKPPSKPGQAAAQSIQSGSMQTASFLDLSNVLFSGLSALDDIRVDQLRFNAKDNSLRLRLIYPDFDAAGRLEQSIRKTGAILTTGGVREQDGAFVGEATLTLGAGS